MYAGVVWLTQSDMEQISAVIARWEVCSQTVAGVDIIYVEHLDYVSHSRAPFKAVATALVTEISGAHWLHRARARCQRKGAVSNATMAALYLRSGGKPTMCCRDI